MIYHIKYIKIKKCILNNNKKIKRKLLINIYYKIVFIGKYII